MTKRLFESLTTLLKVEDLNITTLQPKIQDILGKIENIDVSIKKIDEDIDRVKNFLSNNLDKNFDSLNYFSKSNQQKLRLENEKKNYEAEFEKLYQILMEHVKKSKSYDIVKTKIKSSLQEEEEKKEEDSVNDIVQMRQSFSDSENY